MSNHKGNNIEAIQRNLVELGVKYQKSMVREKEDGLKISDLLDQNDRQAVEIRRLNKAAEETMNDYDKICNGCTTSISKQIVLTKQIRKVKNLNNWLVFACLISVAAIIKLMTGEG